MGVHLFDERALVSNPVLTKEGSKSDHGVSPGLQPTHHLMAHLNLLCAYSWPFSYRHATLAVNVTLCKQESEFLILLLLLHQYLMLYLVDAHR